MLYYSLYNSFTECKIDFAFAVDGSGSIEVDNPVKGNWAILLDFLEDVIDGFEIGPDETRVAMVKFDERSVAIITVLLKQSYSKCYRFFCIK